LVELETLDLSILEFLVCLGGAFYMIIRNDSAFFYAVD
jgi:hypothetical protein